ncbi:uncharacterized protein LOC123293132 [Chrysoperla carnea]|uniref:uncharacterized protein LOC123293132 n=1 Tax=Chrysoperla carnea TaxID=189513 RepID=UPI001D07DEDC|nr:uncharacterized protein LOC123293132 [Chrysoperla carnea]
MLTSRCVVMPREKGDSEPAAFYSLNNNNNTIDGKTTSDVKLRSQESKDHHFHQNHQDGGGGGGIRNSVDSPRLRVRNITAQQKQSQDQDQQRKPMLLQKHPSRTSQTHIDKIFTNCNTRAMRYYRIWIYTCNAVLLVSMLGFCAVAGKTILGDYRRHLIPSLALYQPSFLYAYLAIFTQSGVIQIVGCLGALRLSERLLNVYWLMLLVLLFGDVVIGIFWMFRLDKMIQELRPGLKFRLYNEYGHNNEWTVLWDRLQLETACCGVQNPLDYANFRSSQQQYHQQMVNSWAQATVVAATTQTSTVSIAQNAANVIISADNSTSTVSASASASASAAASATAAAIRILVPPSCCMGQDVIVTEANVTFLKCPIVHHTGCEDRLRTYLRHTSETLFLIGYCVIAFVKVCFIGILRYEIREMIQKIKLLKAEMESRPSIASIDLGSSPNIGTTSPSHTVLLSSAGTQNVNGSVRGAGMEGGTESERESLLVQDQETPAHRQHHHRTSLSADDLEYHQKSALHRKLFPGDSSAADSESHCALLVDEGTTIKTPPNGNNNYEMREFQQIHQPTTMVTTQQYTIHNRGYRLSNPDTQTHNM